MAIKDFISWLTGDDSADSWPKGTAEFMLPKPGDDEDPIDPDGATTTKATTEAKVVTGGATPNLFSDAFYADVRRDMDRMSEQLAAGGGFGKRMSSNLLARSTPKIDETSDTYSVSVEFAGYAEKDIKVEVLDNALIVTAEKRSDREDGDPTHRISEHFVNRMQRRVPLERPIIPSTLSSSFDNGMLHLTVHKKS
jgi:HSP20 family molecular chaperone IbpA